MTQEREKGELLYRFVMNLFRITETKHYNNGLSFIEKYYQKQFNVFLYLNLVQCRHTTGQVELFAQHCHRLHVTVVFDATTSDSGDRAIPARCIWKHDIYFTELQKRHCNKVMFL